MADNKSKITDEQSERMKTELDKITHCKREHKVLAIGPIGRTKFPIRPFTVFRNDVRKNSPTKIHASDIVSKWNALSESERKIYIDTSIASFEQYKYD